MSNQFSRRTFVQGTVGLGVAGVTAALPRRSMAAASSEVHIGCVGVGGKGWSDMEETSAGNQIVAICDVDEARLAKAAEKFPKAKRYTDWRKLLEQTDIDAVTVSIPDHMHAPVTMSALQAGKHTYTQKPLSHSVFEARQLAAAAKNTRPSRRWGFSIIRIPSSRRPFGWCRMASLARFQMSMSGQIAPMDFGNKTRIAARRNRRPTNCTGTTGWG